jgi:hypothetical protein
VPSTLPQVFAGNVVVSLKFNVSGSDIISHARTRNLWPPPLPPFLALVAVTNLASLIALFGWGSDKLQWCTHALLLLKLQTTHRIFNLRPHHAQHQYRNCTLHATCPFLHIRIPSHFWKCHSHIYDVDVHTTKTAIFDVREIGIFGDAVYIWPFDRSFPYHWPDKPIVLQCHILFAAWLVFSIFFVVTKQVGAPSVPSALTECQFCYWLFVSESLPIMSYVRHSCDSHVIHVITRCDFVAYGQGMQKTFQRFFML